MPVIDSILELRVAELAPRDAGRGLARVSLKLMAELGVRSGGLLELHGSRVSAVRVLPAATGSEMDASILLDALSRANAGVALAEMVRVKVVQPSQAVGVVLEAHGSSPAIADLRTLLLDRVVSLGDRIRVDLYGAKPVEFTVRQLEPNAASVIVPSTRLALDGASERSANAPAATAVNYDDIGGLTKEVARVRELVELPLRYPQVFEQLGIEAPKGVLLFGPPGTGKTTIARAVARETKASFFSVAGPEIIGKFYGDSEKRLREVFEEARKKAPSIIFLDEIDAIAPKRSEVQGEVEKRVVAQLLSLMDGLGGRGQVVVIGATNRPDSLDPALRRPGRFDREVLIAPPDIAGRREILEVHTRGMPLAENVDLQQLANITHGFVGADLAALCREAAMNRVRLQLPLWIAAGGQPSASELLALEVRHDDFQSALREIAPSLIREGANDISEASWSDIGGLAQIKTALREAVELPLLYPELFAALKLEPPRGILLTGAPGTGKTLVAKAVAKETQANFISVRGAQFLSKYYGESEKAVRELFAKSRATAPCIVFFDEIDALLSSRDTGQDAVSERIVGQFLAEMDGTNALGSVVIIGATNRPQALDPALLRAGRFEQVLEFTLPTQQERLEILQVHLRDRPHQIDSLEVWADKTQGWSGAKLALLVRRAALSALREALCFNNALSNVENVTKNQPDNVRLDTLSMHILHNNTLTGDIESERICWIKDQHFDLAWQELS